MDRTPKLTAADRAAVLTEAADMAARHSGCPCNSAESIVFVLRRMAAEQAALDATLPADRAALGVRFGEVLRRWGVLDEQNDPELTEEFVVASLLSVLSEYTPSENGGEE